MKYRIWDKKDNRYVKILNDISNLERENFLTDGETVYVIHKDLQLFKDCNQDKFVIERSTGLEDKNGIEIYFNDKVRILGTIDVAVTEIDIDELAIIKYDKTDASYFADCINKREVYVMEDGYMPIDKFMLCEYDEEHPYEIEVIGTIHDKENK